MWSSLVSPDPFSNHFLFNFFSFSSLELFMRFCAEKLQLRFIKIRVSRVAICDSIFDFSAPVTNFATPINFWDITNLHLCLENFEICKVYVIFFMENEVESRTSEEEQWRAMCLWWRNWCLVDQLEETHCSGHRAVQTSVGHLRAAQRVKRERQREREIAAIFS